MAPTNDPRDCCAHWYDDDGVDFRHERRREKRQPDPKRLARLCSTVRRLAEQTINERAHVGELMRVDVICVSPHQGSACLAIAVAFPEAASSDETDRSLARLRGLLGPLRAEIAASVSRKRVPSLMVRLATQQELDDAE